LNTWEKDGETKHSVKRSLNKAKVKASGNAPVQSAAEPWNGGADVNDPIPF
jgi:hypothetical protein